MTTALTLAAPATPAALTTARFIEGLVTASELGEAGAPMLDVAALRLDIRRAGVSEGEIMRLCGWETRSMFDRYNVIDEGDLARAVAKRYGTVAAQFGPSQEPMLR
jgi:hypothetical protein